jgi:hypothetical protein
MNVLIKTTKNDFVGEQLNQEFIDTRYNKDYNDTITAINNLTPQKELFNFGFLPTKIIKPDNELKVLLKEGSVFQFLLPPSFADKMGKAVAVNIWGDNILYKGSERTKIKFKEKYNLELY